MKRFAGIILFLSLLQGVAYSAERIAPDSGSSQAGSVEVRAPEEAGKTPVAAPEGPFGYVHGSLSLTGAFTDNAFNTKTDKKSDFSLLLSPEIWTDFKPAGVRPAEIGDVSTRSPGGLVLSRSLPEQARLYNMHLLYRAEIPLTSIHSPSGSSVSQTLRAGASYEGNRLFVDVNDQIDISYEERGIGLSTTPGEVNTYKSNLFNVVAAYDIGHRSKLRLDYSNFFFRSDSLDNRFRDRTDNAVAAYFYYRVRPRTSMFVGYSFIDVAYVDHSLDSKEQQFFGGLQWDMTAKSGGSIRVGYGVKDFAGAGGNNGNFIVEAQVRHQFTPKTVLSVTAFRKTNETSLFTTFYTITDGVRAAYQQRLTPKITGYADLAFLEDRYQGALNFGGESKERTDRIFQAGAGLQYEFRRWLSAAAGYTHTRRNSNFSDFSFSNNSLYFRITGAF